MGLSLSLFGRSCPIPSPRRPQGHPGKRARHWLNFALAAAACLGGPADAQIGLSASASSHVFGSGGANSRCESPSTSNPAFKDCGESDWSTTAAAWASPEEWGLLLARAAATGRGRSCYGDSAATLRDEIVAVGRASTAQVYFDFDVQGSVSGPIQCCVAGPGCDVVNTNPAPQQRACLTVTIQNLTSITTNLSESPNGIVRVGPFNMTMGTRYNLTISLAVRAVSGGGSNTTPSTTSVDFFTNGNSVRLLPLVMESGGQPVTLARARGQSCHQYLGPETSTELFVKTDGDPEASGADWNSAMGSLQDALLLAKLPCGVREILLKAGTYRPGPFDGSKNSYFGLVNGLTISGCYTGNPALPFERNLSDPAFRSILSGDLNDNDGSNFANRADNVYHVVRASGGVGTLELSAALDGLTISGGHANLNGPSQFEIDGGGMRVIEAAVVLRNCRFTDNYAYRNGGGVYGTSWGALTFENTSFEGNLAAGAEGGGGGAGGGALAIGSYVPTLRHCVFKMNQSGRSGAAVLAGRGVVAEDCDFIENRCNGSAGSGGSGAALSLQGGTLTDCRFVGNSAWDGGAINSWLASPLTLQGCEFRLNRATDGNTSSGSGGAVFVSTTSASALTISDCEFVQNSANFRGGAVAALMGGGPFTVTECLFEGNSQPLSCAGGGGAIFCTGYADLRNVRLLGNTARLFGGAVMSSTQSCYLRDCEFRGNRLLGGCSDGEKGHHFAGTLTLATNCLFANGLGWPVSLAITNPNAALFNCTIAHNAGYAIGHCSTPESARPRLTNCVVWGNTGLLYNRGCTSNGGSYDNPTGVYSDIQGLLLPGAGNIQVNPDFADPDGPDDDPSTWADNDFTLTPGSPCIDAGSSPLVPLGITADLAGADRFVDDPCTPNSGVSDPDRADGAVVDMGAFEYQPPYCAADFNQDGGIDGIDVGAFFAAWENNEPIADVNQDGGIDGTDTQFFFSLWEAGGCCG